MRAWLTLIALINVAVINEAAWNLDGARRRVVLALSIVALTLALLGLSLTERGT